MLKFIKNKKIISLICIATLILTTLSASFILNASAETTIENNVWDGTTATAFAGGTGTATDPYQITNGAQLAYMLSDEGATKNKHYKIMNNIYLNNVYSDDWTNKTNLNNWFEGKTFSGHLDGGSHIIYGLYYSNATNWAALIPILRSPDAGANEQTASIKNVGIKNAYVKAGNGGLILAKVETIGTSVENCFADETATLECSTRQGFVAYVNTNGFSMNKCYFTGILSSTSGAANNSAGGSAGLIGDLGGTSDFTGASVRNSYAITDGLNYDNRVLVKDDKVKKFTFSNVYGNQFAGCHENLSGLTKISSTDNMKGANAKTSMSGLDFIDDYIALDGKYPILRSFYKIWDGSIAISYSGGNGDENDPYKITNGAELAKMITSTAVDDTKNKHFIIMNDIYLNDVSNDNWMNSQNNNWFTGGSKIFYGHLDGGSHVIYGIFYPDDNNDWAGLIPVIQAAGGCTASIKNLGIENAKIVGNYAGGFVGKPNSSNGTIIKNCYIKDSVLKGTAGEGGIIANISAQKSISVENCYSKVTFAGTTNNKGGLIGNLYNPDNTIVFTNCYSITPANVPVSYPNSSPLYIDCYGNVAASVNLQGMTILSNLNDYYGRNSYSKMQFFKFVDFVPQWNDTPVLRSFYDFTEYDVNADDIVDKNDTELLRKYLLGFDDETLDFAGADAYNNGKIDIVDLVAVDENIGQ